MKIYVIWDNNNKCYYRKGVKVAWCFSGAAKNAVMGTITWYDKRDRGIKCFEDQDRFVIKEIDVEEYFEMQYRLESLEK